MMRMSANASKALAAAAFLAGVVAARPVSNLRAAEEEAKKHFCFHQPGQPAGTCTCDCTTTCFSDPAPVHCCNGTS